MGRQMHPIIVCPIMEQYVETDIINILWNTQFTSLSHRMRVIKVGRAKWKSLNIICTITKTLNQVFLNPEGSPTLKRTEIYKSSDSYYFPIFV